MPPFSVPRLVSHRQLTFLFLLVCRLVSLHGFKHFANTRSQTCVSFFLPCLKFPLAIITLMPSFASSFPYPHRSSCCLSPTCASSPLLLTPPPSSPRCRCLTVLTPLKAASCLSATHWVPYLYLNSILSLGLNDPKPCTHKHPFNSYLHCPSSCCPSVAILHT